MGERAFTYIEILAAIMVLSIALIPLLSQFYIGFQANQTGELVSQATNLAEALMEEIKTKRFDENEFPVEPVNPASLGTDSGETIADRRTLDDIDDYHTLQENPPTTSDGIVLNEFSLFRRQVTVDYVALSSGAWIASGVRTYYKRITVNVTHPKIGSRALETIMAHY
ncbi:MAG: type II secretion system GspH family protein [Candidatus Omnitrophica bacterium]|nr:type II secretion system GspH family protein [Candidatus Omnitrophota bacterium]